MINSFPPDLSTLWADTWVESRVYVWLTIWLTDQDHDEWQYNNQLPWRRALSLVLSITPSVFHQPVSTAWRNVNVRSQQWLRPQFSQSEGAYLQELRQPPATSPPPGELYLPVILLSLICHRCILLQQCPWNALTTPCLTRQHVPATETAGWKKGDLWPETCNQSRLWWPCVCLRLWAQGK